MNEEDEAFNEIERQAGQRKEAVRRSLSLEEARQQIQAMTQDRATLLYQSKGTSMIEEDDDIQDYKKPWVGLTVEEVYEIYTSVEEKVNEHWNKGGTTMMFPPTLYKAIEAKLKEKNT